MYDALVIYDAECSYHEKISSAFESADALKTVDINDESVQEFLDTQFNWQPYAFIVIDGDTVYVGEHATEQLVTRLGVPGPVTQLAQSRASPVSSVVSTLVRKKDTDPVHGEFPLQPDARDYVESVMEGTSVSIN